MERHRKLPKFFTRKRSLLFEIVMMLIIQKSLKSIQNHMNCFWDQLAQWVTSKDPVTTGAWTQARAKLSHKAFVELNQSTIVEPFYQSEQPKILWHDLRLLAIDGSTVTLPQAKEIFDYFGTVECTNKNGEPSIEYPQARMSMLYDVLNKLVVDPGLENHHTGEHEMALRHVEQGVGSSDLLLLDRGYPSFMLFLNIVQKGGNFVCRCSKGSFAIARKLHKQNRKGVSLITTLQVPKELKNKLKEQKLPVSLKVRFVTVRLSTGELEVLVTSLLDDTLYKTEEFKELYNLRWGVETYYGLVKGRLALENFSGKTVEAVKQDFHATVFISNLESVLIEPAQEKLDVINTEGRKEPAALNHSGSFHAIKNEVIRLFYTDIPAEQILERLTKLFMYKPVSCRKGRKVERKKFSRARSLRFQRYVKKIGF